MTSGTGYGQANGIRMAYGVHLAPTNDYGHKEGWIVYLHGIDHVGPRPTSDTDYGTLDIVANKGVAFMIKDGPLPYFQQPGGGPTDLYRWNVIFPQCSSEFATWPFAYPSEMIKKVKATYAATTDTTRIMVVGYSFGGGCVMTACKDAYLNANVSRWVNIAGGYNASPNYPFVANSGAIIECYHSAADPTAPVANTDNFVNGVSAQHPVNHIKYIRFSDLPGSPTNDHDRIRFIMEDLTKGGVYPLSNGDTWTRDELIYESGLRETTQRRKRA